MHYKEKPDQAWSDVPSSLNHHSLELQDAKRASPTTYTDSAGETTPYLGLRSRLSQVWFNRWTILLALVLVRVLLSLGSLNEDIVDSKEKALQACTKVEDIGSAMASMPHYLSVGVNSLAADGISKTVRGMVEILSMILTAIESLIFFILNMWIGTYVCLTSALITGAFDMGIGVADGATKAVNEGITKVAGGIADEVKNVQDLLNRFAEKFNGAARIVGQSIEAPKLDIGSKLDELKGFKVDSSQFVGSLTELKKNVPTYDDAKKATQDAIAIPFDFVRKALNSTYGAYQFKPDVFPVAEKRALNFCRGNPAINDFFDNLFKLAATAKTVFIAVICVLAVVAMGVMAWWEIKRYRRQQARAKVLTQHGFDPMDVVYISSRPLTAGSGIWIAEKLGVKGKRQLLVRWAVAYGTSLPAIFVLSLAIAGFFSCFLQWTVMKAIQTKAPELANQVGDFAGQVVKTLDDVSNDWSESSNGVITKLNDDINHDVFGWVVNSTSAVNNTLNQFTSTINKGIDTAFGGTVLYSTVQGVVRCLIGIKIEAVETGLTWVHDHAKVTLPRFPNDTFSQGSAKSIGGDSELTSFLSSPSSVTTDEITDAVNRVVNHLRNNIVQEALISAGLFAVYVIVVLAGIVRAAVGMVGSDKTRGDGGQRFVTASNNPSLTGDHRAPLSPRSPRRSKSETHMRFPEFSRNSGDAETAAMDDADAARIRDEQLAQAHPVRRGTGILGGKSKGHWRGSSHGQIGDAGSSNRF